MVATLRRRAPLLAVLLGLALSACVYFAASMTLSVFAWLGGWRWPNLLLSIPAAMFILVIVIELYAAAILSLLQLVLRLGYDIGRAHFGAVLAIAACCAGGIAAMRFWSEPAAVPPPWDVVAAALIASAAIAVALWFARTYLRPAARRFRSFHVDLVEARRALEGARHGA